MPKREHHDIGYFMSEGAKNMFTHGFMSFAAIGITVACLLIMGTFTLVAVNADANLQELEDTNEILAFVDESLSYAEAKALGTELERIDNVASVEFITREEARENFEAKYEDEALYQDLDDDIFRHRYAIRLRDISQTAETVGDVLLVDGIAKVNAYEEASNGFITLRNIAGVVCLTLVAILLLVSLFIIANTIKLTTFDRRDEIAIMKMVGASNGFIRWPFVYEGFLMGVLSAVIAFFLQWGLYAALTRGIDTSDAISLIQVVPFGSMWHVVALVFLAAGVVIGVGGSLSAIRQFLKV